MAQAENTGRVRSKIVMAAIMSCAMSGMVTLLATFVNLGPVPGFLLRWLKAWSFAWPIAGITAYAVMPIARRLTEYVSGRMDTML